MVAAEFVQLLWMTELTGLGNKAWMADRACRLQCSHLLWRPCPASVGRGQIREPRWMERVGFGQLLLVRDLSLRAAPSRRFSLYIV